MLCKTRLPPSPEIGVAETWCEADASHSLAPDVAQGYLADFDCWVVDPYASRPIEVAFCEAHKAYAESPPGTPDPLFPARDTGGWIDSQTGEPWDCRPTGSEGDFSLGKVERNKKKGTAKLSVTVGGPGFLELAKNKKVKGAELDLITLESEQTVKVPIKPTPKAKTLLNRQGAAKVKAVVTFHSEAGERNTAAKTVKLVKRD